ncbi:GRRM system radical SAM/SPASM domain protein [bacterium]|jgi:uncharacterized protein|nr:GRRM system radical SAM/SPASM domain protein [bacterium]
MENKCSRHLVVIQPSSYCNLNCKYCYVPDRDKKNVISDSLLEEIISKVINSDELSKAITLLWHAGEPLSVGIGFYKKVNSLIKKYNKNNKKIIYNSIQTNATYINDEWCHFFKENDYKISISCDGPEFLHNLNRVTWSNRGSYNLVMRGINKLNEHNIPVSMLCTVTRETLKYPQELFQFFVDSKIKKIGLNPEGVKGRNKNGCFRDNELTTILKEYRVFIEKLFELWKTTDNPLKIREFDVTLNIINQKKKDPNFKQMRSNQNALEIITIQKNGNISTFCPELAGGTFEDPNKFVIKNITEIDDFSELRSSKKLNTISEQIINGHKKCEKNCEYFDLCGGGNPNAKMYEKGTFDCDETTYCNLSRKLIYETVISGLS